MTLAREGVTHAWHRAGRVAVTGAAAGVAVEAGSTGVAAAPGHVGFAPAGGRRSGLGLPSARTPRAGPLPPRTEGEALRPRRVCGLRTLWTRNATLGPRTTWAMGTRRAHLHWPLSLSQVGSASSCTPGLEQLHSSQPTSGWQPKVRGWQVTQPGGTVRGGHRQWPVSSSHRRPSQSQAAGSVHSWWPLPLTEAPDGSRGLEARTTLPNSRPCSTQLWALASGSCSDVGAATWNHRPRTFWTALQSLGRLLPEVPPERRWLGWSAGPMLC